MQHTGESAEKDKLTEEVRCRPAWQGATAKDQPTPAIPSPELLAGPAHATYVLAGLQGPGCRRRGSAPDARARCACLLPPLAQLTRAVLAAEPDADFVMFGGDHVVGGCTCWPGAARPALPSTPSAPSTPPLKTPGCPSPSKRPLPPPAPPWQTGLDWVLSQEPGFYEYHWGKLVEPVVEAGLPFAATIG